jgi:hypothetical protein
MSRTPHFAVEHITKMMLTYNKEQVILSVRAQAISVGQKSDTPLVGQKSDTPLVGQKYTTGRTEVDTPLVGQKHTTGRTEVRHTTLGYMEDRIGPWVFLKQILPSQRIPLHSRISVNMKSND